MQASTIGGRYRFADLIFRVRLTRWRRLMANNWTLRARSLIAMATFLLRKFVKSKITLDTSGFCSITEIAQLCVILPCDVHLDCAEFNLKQATWTRSIIISS